MFQIVRCMLDEKGDVVVRSPTKPVFEIREDAAAMAEFDASRVAGDYGYDEEHDSWWAIDSAGECIASTSNKWRQRTLLHKRRVISALSVCSVASLVQLRHRDAGGRFLQEYGVHA